MCLYHIVGVRLRIGFHFFFFASAPYVQCSGGGDRSSNICRRMRAFADVATGERTKKEKERRPKRGRCYFRAFFLPFRVYVPGFTYTRVSSIYVHNNAFLIASPPQQSCPMYSAKGYLCGGVGVSKMRVHTHDGQHLNKIRPNRQNRHLGQHAPLHEARPLHHEAVRQVVEQAARQREGLHAAEGLDEDDLDALDAQEAEGIAGEAEGEAGAFFGDGVLRF